MLPGQHVGVNYADGTTIPPASTYKSDQAFFEVKLLVSIANIKSCVPYILLSQILFFYS